MAIGPGGSVFRDQLDHFLIVKTNTPVPVEVYQPGQIITGENGEQKWVNEAGELVEMPRIGSTYFDAEQGIDVYFAGPEVGYVDVHTYIVDRIRNSNDDVAHVGLYGAMEPIQGMGEALINHEFEGLLQWRENAEKLAELGTDTSSMEAFWRSLDATGMVVELAKPAKGRFGGVYTMDGKISTDVNRDRVIVEVYGPEPAQYEPVKYGDGPMKALPQDIIVYNDGNGIQAGISEITIDGIKYVRFIVIFGKEYPEFDRNKLRTSEEQRQLDANFANKLLTHLGFLAGNAQRNDDEDIGLSQPHVYFWNTQLDIPGANWGNDFRKREGQITVLKPVHE